MTFLGLNAFDLVVLGVIVLSGLFALMRGLVKEILSIVSWVGALFAAL
jgi:membrane protein required for colicin V production